MFRFDARFLILAASLLCPLFLPAQDTRTVVEPSVPAVCTTLSAQLAAPNGVLPEADEDKADTARIQSAIDKCGPGKAVELKPAGQNNAFLAGPLELKPGVTLLVDTDATLFGSRNPRDYDRTAGSCGLVNKDGSGCKPLIFASKAPGSAIMGDGAIDARGGAKLLGQNVTWWELADQARAGGKQNCPRLLQIDHSNNFILYGITLRNSPNFHVVVVRTDGFTAWGMKIDTPKKARNTDGIDPSGSTNITITHSYIRTGDDHIAVKAGNTGATSHMTVADNHFYSGHGMSIGSEVNSGVSGIRVSDLTIDGADDGLRIKSDASRGGPVRDVAYENVCIRDTKEPIVMDPFYAKEGSGELIPTFQDIRLKNVRISGGSKMTLVGYDAQHPLKISFDGVIAEGMKPENIRAAHAEITDGPGQVTLAPKGEDVQLKHLPGKGAEVTKCTGSFVPYPEGPAIPKLQGAPVAGKL
jgi:polygalacturonase